MRKVWALALAPLLTLAFLVIGNTPANAFGSEVLGCAVETAAWTSPTCAGGGSDDTNDRYVIHYSARNLSGTYGFAWTITQDSGTTGITRSCTSTTDYNCILSGCTTTWVCDFQVRQAPYAHTFTAKLRLTQSGQSRTISATATIHKLAGITCPPSCQ